MEAWVDTPALYWPEIQKDSIDGTWDLDSVQVRCASLFQAPRDGTVTGLRFYLRGVTTGQSVTCALQGTNSGDPDGSDLASGSVSVADTDDNTLKTITFGSSVNVTRGSWYAIVWRWAASAGSLQINACGSALRVNAPSRYYAFGSWSNLQGSGSFCLTWADGVRVSPAGTFPAFKRITEGITHDGTPDEVGNRFVLSFDAYATAIWFHYGNYTDGDIRTATLYDDSKVLNYFSIEDSFNRMGTETAELLLPKPLLLKAGRTYRVTVQPSVNWPDSLTAYGFEFVDTAGLGAAGPIDCYRTERTNSGSWTDTTTKRLLAGVRLAKVSTGSAPGGWMPQGTIVHEGPPIIMPGQG